MTRHAIIASATIAAVAAAILGAATPALADTAAPVTSITVAAPSAITLPAHDGFRDSASVVVTSSAPTTGIVTITSTDGLKVRTDAVPLNLSSEKATLVVPVDGLTAGHYLLTVTAADGGTGTAPLTVGSGVATSATLTPARRDLFPASSASLSTTTVQTVVRDETGIAIPAHGVLTLSAGKSSRTATFTATGATPAKVTISSAGLPVASSQLVAVVARPNESAATLGTINLRLHLTAINAVTIARSASTVYPRHDGYLDSASFTVTSTTTTESKVAATGSAVLKFGKKTVKKWTLHSSSATLTWSGHYKGITQGTYHLSLAIKGPQGSQHKASTTISVSKKHLVTKSSARWVTAKSVTKKYLNYDIADLGFCAFDGGSVECQAYDAYYDDGSIALFSLGSVSLPTTVRSALVYGGASVRLTADVASTDGTILWDYGTTSTVSKVGQLTTGTHTLNWLALHRGDTSFAVAVGLGEYADSTIDRFKIEFRWKALSN